MSHPTVMSLYLSRGSYRKWVTGVGDRAEQIGKKKLEGVEMGLT